MWSADLIYLYREWLMYSRQAKNQFSHLCTGSGSCIQAQKQLKYSIYRLTQPISHLCTWSGSCKYRLATNFSAFVHEVAHVSTDSHSIFSTGSGACKYRLTTNFFTFVQEVAHLSTDSQPIFFYFCTGSGSCKYRLTINFLCKEWRM
jgi:hypothetical protein